MKKLITIIFSFIALTSIGQDYKLLIKDVPGLEKYPDASVINVYTKVDVNIKKDNSYTKHIFFIKKILNYKGKVNFSDIKITYNANLEKVTIGNCFSVRDGKETPTPQEAQHDNGSYLSMYSPEYVNQRETVINMPAVEPNDFIVIEYTIEGIGRSFVSGDEVFQQENPYLHKELNISVPKSINLSYKYNEAKVKLIKSMKEDNNIYQFVADNIPMIKDENNKPSNWIIGSPVFYSTKASWTEAIPDLFKQFKSVNYETEAIKNLMPDLATSKASNEDKLRMIYGFIQQNFIFKYSLSEDDFTPQPVAKLFEQHFGSNKELTALFISMAKYAGIEVKPIFAISQTDVKETKEIPCRNFITNLYAYYNGSIISLANKNAPYGYTWFEKAFLITDENPSKVIDYQFNTKDLYKEDVKININTDFSAKALFSKELKGDEDFGIRYQFKDETEKKRKIWFTSNIEDKSITVDEGPEFIDIQNLGANLKIKFGAHIDNFYTIQGNYLYMQLPETKKVNLQLTGKERENPYQIDNTISVTEKYVFDNLSKEYTVVKPLDKIEKTLKSDDGDMSFTITTAMENGKLTVYRKIFIPQTIISKEAYPAFYEFISTIQKPLNTVVFLQK